MIPRFTTRQLFVFLAIIAIILAVVVTPIRRHALHGSAAASLRAIGAEVSWESGHGRVSHHNSRESIFFSAFPKDTWLFLEAGAGANSPKEYDIAATAIRHLCDVKRVHLFDGDIDVNCSRVLSGLPPHLDYLYIVRCTLTDTAWLRQLKEVDFLMMEEIGGIGDLGFSCLSHMRMKNVAWYDHDATSSDLAVALLSSTRTLEELIWTRFDQETCDVLAKCTALHTVSIRHSAVSADDVRRLCRLPSLVRVSIEVVYDDLASAIKRACESTHLREIHLRSVRGHAVPDFERLQNECDMRIRQEIHPTWVDIYGHRVKSKSPGRD